MPDFPIAVHIGSSTLLLHAVCETAGIFIGFRYFLYLKKQKGDPLETSSRVWILIAACVGSVLGARILGIFEDPAAFFTATKPLSYFVAQKTIVGGLLGGLACVELSKSAMKEKTPSGDLFVFPLLLAMVIGRVGCFSMGVYEETYGLPTSTAFGINLGDGVLRHPVALYEIAFLLILWFALGVTQKKYDLQNGALFKLFMIAYLVFRFLLDFLKPHFTFSIGLSAIQIACVSGLLWYLRYLRSPVLLLNARQQLS